MSKIEWTDKTWNPIVGCKKVSDGCRNCYAMYVADRQDKQMHQEKYAGLVTVLNNKERNWNGEVKFVWEDLFKPLFWKKPCKIFVNSMSDLFYEKLTVEQIACIFAVFILAPQHQYMVLTKRAKRMSEILNSKEFVDKLHYVLQYVKWWYGTEIAARKNPALKKYPWSENEKILEFIRKYYDENKSFNGLDGPEKVMSYGELKGMLPLPNVFLGVSVEDQKAADERIQWLLATPAHTRFLSCEPLLGPLDLGHVKYGNIYVDCMKKINVQCWNESQTACKVHTAKIDWVIVGGESGRYARPMNREWALKLRDACISNNVPFFFKQWGEWVSLDYLEVDAVDSTFFYENPKRDLIHVIPNKRNPKLVHNWEEPLNISVKVGKKKAGRSLSGEYYNQFPISK